MARITLVFESLTGAAFLPETICKEELPIYILTEKEPVICKFITQEEELRHLSFC